MTYLLYFYLYDCLVISWPYVLSAWPNHGSTPHRQIISGLGLIGPLSTSPYSSFSVITTVLPVNTIQWRYLIPLYLIWTYCPSVADYKRYRNFILSQANNATLNRLLAEHAQKYRTSANQVPYYIKAGIIWILL